MLQKYKRITLFGHKPRNINTKTGMYIPGPPGKGALLYSSGWPELRFANGTTTVLSNPVGTPTVKPTRLYTILMVRFADKDSRDKVRELMRDMTERKKIHLFDDDDETSTRQLHTKR